MKKTLCLLLAFSIFAAPLAPGLARADDALTPTLADQEITKQFGGDVSKASTATTGQILIRQADGSWAPGANGGSAPGLNAVLTVSNTTGAKNILVDPGQGIGFRDASPGVDQIKWGTGGAGGINILGATDQGLVIASGVGRTLILASNGNAGNSGATVPTSGHLQVTSVLDMGAVDTNAARQSAGLWVFSGQSASNYATLGNGGLNLQAAGVAGWSSSADATAAADTTIIRSGAGALQATGNLGLGHSANLSGN